MILYRCSLSKWSKDLNGQGAFLYGGRWNSPGHRMIYTSENNLLAALEISVRIPLTKISSDYVMIPIHIPDNPNVLIPTLAKNWASNSKYTQTIGNKFLTDNQFLLMRVPSVLMNNTFNYLINPMHKDMKKVKIEKVLPLVFDERLIKLMRQDNE